MFIYNGTNWALDRTTTFLTEYGNSSILRHADMMTLNFQRVLAGNGKIYYGYSTTAASTANKVVVCPEVTALDSDFILYVTFSVTNTAATPKINVNSLGAVNIAGIANSTSKNNMSLEANYIYALKYKLSSNSFYIIHKISHLETRSSWYFTSSTAAGTAAKVAAYSTAEDRVFCLIRGITVYLDLTVANTASNPTLNINNTGAKAIYNGSTKLTGAALKAGLYHLVYDGTQYKVLSMPS